MEKAETKRYAVLAFGGQGNRFGWVKPKQFYPIKNDKTILEYIVEKFISFDLFDKIILLSPENYIDETKRIISGISDFSRNSITILPGGDTRQHSIWNAISFLKDFAYDEDIVLIHDGARPLITEDIILRNLEECRKFGAVVTAISATDTVSYSGNGELIDEIIPRSKIHLHQTPQTFKFEIIRKSMEEHLNMLHLFSDDASIVLASGYSVKYVNGSRANIKITTMEDIEIAKKLIEKSEETKY
ncbi:IspD/TarI family cytidylyltransferase [Fervidobacterium nodosum]|uniref:4-diphosphocytidyl-2C-methyl-D-erythritol synthase n=1 Tax=Fervidobacterium nodosum (strain ATCC 35602 / DSM 5306 / Rt17-B1) TaxID=381764 RepID=A7HJG7_FERNB|nr:IspD/TarI family cytidylyltransferase [Fervidobacterium nodosum]ABS60050.1 4-diphosphocytidyl-2C-methyl-D-erythritol synthase [Fervidobacterium nodosum Rt17-B1]HOJ94094.1 IspD/TarI family cytidylyltransferase [Fervidobacterium nodosum]